MSLPDWQQRVLDRMEGALQASEPHLASMFAIFARLHASDPVGAEPLARPQQRRRRRSPPGTAVYAFVFIPVMFALIVCGALLGSGARSARACEDGYSVDVGSTLFSQPSCQAAGKQGTGKQGTAKSATGKQGTAKSATGEQATEARATREAVTGQGDASCSADGIAVQPAAWTGSDLASSPPEGSGAAAGGKPPICYK
jgi:hypothetical protein